MTQPIKVNAVWLVQEGVYLVTLPHHGSRTYYVIADIKVTTNTVTVKSLDEISAYRNIDGRISHFSDKNGESLSVEEYDKILTELKSKGNLDGYYDVVFSDIDDEYEYKKFISRWSAVYNPPTVELVPLEFVITEIRINSGDLDIVSLWNSPNIRDNHLYSFNRLSFSIKYFKFLCEESDLKYSLPNHGGIRFAKVNENYIFDESFNFSGHPNFIGTLEQCKNEKKKILEDIKREVIVHIKGKESELLNAATVLDALKQIKNSFARVTVISKSRDSFYKTLNQINNLVKLIEDDVINN